MVIIQVHNYYQQAGGEDAVAAAERVLLETHGHEVVLFQRSNDEINGWSPWQKIVRVIWNRQACAELEVLIASFKPDVIHVHNVFHAMSLSVYQAARRKGIPVVQTLHNYRLFCLNGLFFRQSSGVRCEDLSVNQKFLKPDSLNPKTSAAGAICELCLKHRWFPWPGMRYRCYRDSLAGSIAVALMLFVHRLLRTWIKPVSRFIVLTSFCRDKFIQCGIPSEKIALKPNFLSQDPGEGEPVRDPHFLFLGRLTEEKGVRTLVKAWRLFEQPSSPKATPSHGRSEVRDQRSDVRKKLPVHRQLLPAGRTGDSESASSTFLPLADPPEAETASTPSLSAVALNGEGGNDLNAVASQLLIAGTGPLETELSGMAGAGVKMIGHIDRATSVKLLQSVRALVFPSEWYETFGLSVIEAMACGTPVLVGDVNAAASLIRDGETGLLFRAGDPVDLAKKMAWMLTHPVECTKMGRAARLEYEEKYTAEANYKMLMGIYRQIVGECKR
jgi:glycosyltransferase involved in cell wall biosynthesis